MKVLYDNKILTAALSSNNENENYPLDNLQNGVRAKKYRSVTDTGIWIKISTPITATYLVIDSHNLTSDATIHLQGNNSDSWVSPTTDFTVSNVTNDTIVYAFASKTHSYWRITIDDPRDSGDDEYVEIGGIYLGTALQLPGVKPDQSLIRSTNSKSDISEAGAQYGDRRLRFRKFGINFPNISWTDRVNMITMWENNENVVPLYVLLWSDRLDLEAIAYCVIDQSELNFKKSDSPIFPFSTTLNFREVF